MLSRDYLELVSGLYVVPSAICGLADLMTAGTGRSADVLASCAAAGRCRSAWHVNRGQPAIEFRQALPVSQGIIAPGQFVPGLLDQIVFLTKFRAERICNSASLVTLLRRKLAA